MAGFDEDLYNLPITGGLRKCIRVDSVREHVRTRASKARHISASSVAAVKVRRRHCGTSSIPGGNPVALLNTVCTTS